MLNLLHSVEKIAKEAGELAMSFSYDTSNIQYKEGYQESPVTAADLAVDAFLKKELTLLNPQWGWLSEETADDGNWKTTKKFWIVDPIDGTTGFVRYLEDGISTEDHVNQRHHFSISIALIENGQPLLGVIYSPLDNCLMSAAHSLGCFKNGNYIAPPENCSTTLNAYEFLASTSEMKRDLLDFLTPHIHLRRMGSCANKIARVAISNDLVTASVKPKSWWDVAAAACLIKEQNMALTDLAGNNLTFSGAPAEIQGIIATPLKVYKNLQSLLPKKVLATYI